MTSAETPVFNHMVNLTTRLDNDVKQLTYEVERLDRRVRIATVQALLLSVAILALTVVAFWMGR